MNPNLTIAKSTGMSIRPSWYLPTDNSVFRRRSRALGEGDYLVQENPESLYQEGLIDFDDLASDKNKLQARRPWGLQIKSESVSEAASYFSDFSPTHVTESAQMNTARELDNPRLQVSEVGLDGLQTPPLCSAARRCP